MDLTRDDCFRYLTENYHESNQAEAAKALRSFHDHDVIVLLKNVLANNESKDVRQNAAESLGAIGDARSIPFLREALNDRLNVTMAAWNAIKKIGGSEAAQIIEQGPPTLRFSMVLFRWSKLSFWKSLFAKRPPDEYKYCETIAKEHYKSFPVKIDAWRIIGVKRQLSAGEAASLYHNLIKQGTVPNLGNIRSTRDYIKTQEKDDYGFGYIAVFFP